MKVAKFQIRCVSVPLAGPPLPSLMLYVATGTGPA